jgi:hypothetical protein
MAALQTANDEEKNMFYPEWFRPLGLRPISPERLDLEGSYMQELRESLKRVGWKKDEPLKVAMSKDPSINGEVLDGANRLFGCDQIFRETGELPNIIIDHEPIKSRKQLVARIFYYEAPHFLRKSQKKAREHIYSLYESIKADLPGQALDQWLKIDGGFNEASRLQVVVAQINKLEESQRQDSAGGNNNHKPGEWRTQKEKDEAGPLKPEDTFKSYAIELEVPPSPKKRLLAVNVRVYASGKAEGEIVA